MQTVTLPKSAYQKILQNQADLARDLELVKLKMETELADEVSDEYKAKLEKLSKAADRRPGKVFKSHREFSKYLKGLWYINGQERLLSRSCARAWG